MDFGISRKHLGRITAMCSELGRPVQSLGIRLQRGVINSSFDAEILSSRYFRCDGPNGQAPAAVPCCAMLDFLIINAIMVLAILTLRAICCAIYDVGFSADRRSEVQRVTPQARAPGTRASERGNAHSLSAASQRRLAGAWQAWPHPEDGRSEAIKNQLSVRSQLRRDFRRSPWTKPNPHQAART
jgi:hypothetical protein